MPGLTTAGEGCRITLVAVGAEALPAGARETLRLVAERSEARDAAGEWRHLGGRCESPGRGAPRAALALARICLARHRNAPPESATVAEVTTRRGDAVVALRAGW